MKILVVGAGIGGMAASLFLEKKGFDVTLIERALEFKHIGFGMTIFGNGRRLLRELGIDNEISKEGYEAPWIEMIDTHGHVLGQKINFTDLKKFGDLPIAIERASLHEALAKKVKNVKIRLGTTIKDIFLQKDSVQVGFNDGSKDIFDLVVAADGIHSEIRKKFFEKSQNTYYGWSIRFFWMPPSIPVPKGAICLSKEKITLAIYPLGKRGFVGIYEYNPKRTANLPLQIDSFLPYLLKHGWTQKHIEDLKKEAILGHQYYDNLQHIALGRWYKKRIVLLGDARHGISPLTGMGAGMALEDAFVLADELAKADNTQINLALQNYSQRRNKHIRNIISFSNLIERFYFIKSKRGRILRNLIMKFLGEDIFIKRLERVLSEPL